LDVFFAIVAGSFHRAGRHGYCNKLSLVALRPVSLCPFEEV
jgi:hypothetical protein